MSRRLENVLPLQYFIHRQKVIRLFRSMLKLTNQIEGKQLQNDTKIQILNEFRKNQFVEDKMAIKSMIMEGTKQLDFLKALSNNSKPQKVIGKGWPWEKSKISSE
jgi:hypothetical protein